MDPSTEIRKLTPKTVYILSYILDESEQWKRLMNIIPKTLVRDCYECDVTSENSQKYNSDHIRLLESESNKSKRKFAEILFDEWGTSGRIRPTLGHLLYLLVKANLFRAADYIAVELLNQERPRRPSSGPEAPIPATLMQPEIEEFTAASDVSTNKIARESARNVVQQNPRVAVVDVNADVIHESDLIEFSSSSSLKVNHGINSTSYIPNISQMLG